MSLAVVSSLGGVRAPGSPEELEDFEQELIDQFVLAQVGAGMSDKYIAHGRSVVFEFVEFLARPLWTARPGDADRFLAYLRRERVNSKTTVVHKAYALAQLFDFLVDRYQAEIHSMTGHVVEQVIDEHNRPMRGHQVAARVPPSVKEVTALFGAWGPATVEFRKYLPAARNYMAASLWQRVGLRINETIMLDIRDWRPDLGEHGKLHVRFGKGSRGRGHKPRLVPAINSVDQLMTWWLTEVRPQFGDDWSDPDAPLLPSERRAANGRCVRIGDDALRSGLVTAVARWLPAWAGRLTPHGLRHFCASSLYTRGMDLKAIQELLGHTWLSTTTRYIHVHDNHIEQSWLRANQRVTARLDQEG